MAEEYDDNLRELVAEVAAAYFTNTHVSPAEIPNVVSQIATSLLAVGALKAAREPAASEVAAPAKLSASQIKKSVSPDALISFEDGKAYKTLRRHLSIRGLTPEQYREKWGLPRDYPMVAPTYSEARKALAKQIGLGRKPAGEEPARRGRPRTAK